MRTTIAPNSLPDAEETSMPESAGPSTPAAATPNTPAAEATPDLVDLREAPFNDRRTGQAREIQLPASAITTLHAIVLDLDPGLLAPGNPLFPPAHEPDAFLEGIRPVLERHPLARDAEVRATGTGLHLLIRLDPPVELGSAADQRRWDTIVKAVQRSLPSDPNAPGITALTRPIGSISGKTGRRVETLREGTPVAPERVEAFAETLAAAPFRTWVEILCGADRVVPCPLCQRPNSSLGAREHDGICYTCGKVALDRLLEIVYAEPDQPEAAPGSGHTATRGRAKAGR